MTTKRCKHHKTCGDCFSPEALAESELRATLARRALFDVVSALECQAFLARKSRRRSVAGFAQALADSLKTIVARVDDDTLCNNSCKNMYFCDKPKGHKGNHSEQGLAWED